MRDDVAKIKARIEYATQEERLNILTNKLCQEWHTNDHAEYIKELLTLFRDLEIDCRGGTNETNPTAIR